MKKLIMIFPTRSSSEKNEVLLRTSTNQQNVISAVFEWTNCGQALISVILSVFNKEEKKGALFHKLLSLFVTRKLHQKRQSKMGSFVHFI